MMSIRLNLLVLLIIQYVAYAARRGSEADKSDVLEAGGDAEPSQSLSRSGSVLPAEDDSEDEVPASEGDAANTKSEAKMLARSRSFAASADDDSEDAVSVPETDEPPAVGAGDDAESESQGKTLTSQKSFAAAAAAADDSEGDAVADGADLIDEETTSGTSEETPRDDGDSDATREDSGDVAAGPTHGDPTDVVPMPRDGNANATLAAAEMWVSALRKCAMSAESSQDENGCFKVDAKLDAIGKTALIIAAETGHLERVETLLNMGANPLATIDYNVASVRLPGVAAIVVAALKGHTAIVERLCKPSEKLEDTEGLKIMAEKALIAAVRYGKGEHKAVVEALLNHDNCQIGVGQMPVVNGTAGETSTPLTQVIKRITKDEYSPEDEAGLKEIITWLIDKETQLTADKTPEGTHLDDIRNYLFNGKPAQIPILIDVAFKPLVAKGYSVRVLKDGQLSLLRVLIDRALNEKNAVVKSMFDALIDSRHYEDLLAADSERDSVCEELMTRFLEDSAEDGETFAEQMYGTLLKSNKLKTHPTLTPLHRIANAYFSGALENVHHHHRDRIENMMKKLIAKDGTGTKLMENSPSDNGYTPIQLLTKRFLASTANDVSSDPRNELAHIRDLLLLIQPRKFDFSSEENARGPAVRAGKADGSASHQLNANLDGVGSVSTATAAASDLGTSPLLLVAHKLSETITENLGERTKDVEILQLLLEQGADPAQKRSDKVTPLMLLVKHPEFDLTSGNKLSDAEMLFWALWQKAGGADGIDSVELTKLLGAQAPVDVKGKHKQCRTALSDAVSVENKNVLSLLLEHGARPAWFCEDTKAGWSVYEQVDCIHNTKGPLCKFLDQTGYKGLENLNMDLAPTDKEFDDLRKEAATTSGLQCEPNFDMKHFGNSFDAQDLHEKDMYMICTWDTPGKANETMSKGKSKGKDKSETPAPLPMQKVENLIIKMCWSNECTAELDKFTECKCEADKNNICSSAGVCQVQKDSLCWDKQEKVTIILPAETKKGRWGKEKVVKNAETIEMPFASKLACLKDGEPIRGFATRFMTKMEEIYKLDETIDAVRPSTYWHGLKK